MEKNSLFYMANLHPEIERMFSFYDSGKKEAGDNARVRALGIVDMILSFRDVKPAGREEWSAIKNLILGYDKLDTNMRTILEKYAQPFSFKFMNQYTLSH